MHKPSLLTLSILFTSSLASAEDDLSGLMSMSLEELVMLDVTMKTASKFSQKLSDIPAAVYVLGGERIERSGARSIAEALALVPGLNVTKFSETEFFVSARGFHDGLYNKMLVMMDGRSLYSPVYGGVYWTDIDYILADIDRIEVLRGPGGAIWGGNAVNGVINIITKSAKETQGTFVQASSGRAGDYTADARYGFQLDNGVSGRVFAKSKKIDSFADDEHYIRKSESVGFQLENKFDSREWALRIGGEQDSFDKAEFYYQFNGGAYTGFRRTLEEVESYSTYAQFEYSHSDERLQTNYTVWAQQNVDEALDAPGIYRTLDLDASFSFNLSPEQTLLFGGGYRLVEVEFTHTYQNTDFNDLPSFIRIADTGREVDSILNAFVQLESRWGERFTTVAGLKLEYFEHTYALELSPQLRVNYQIDEQQNVWAGIAKAHVSPSYMETNTDYYSVYYASADDDYYVSASFADPNMELEQITSLEAGYRYMRPQFEVDLVLFINQHDNVTSADYVGWSQQFDIDLVNDNYEATSHGLELGLSYTINEDWRLFGSYSYLTLNQQLAEQPISQYYSEDYYDIEQQHMMSVQSLWSINPQWQFDLLLKGQIIEYAAEYEDPQSYNYSHVPNVLALDARVAWQRSMGWPKLELMVQNIGEKEGYVRDYSQYGSSHYYEQLIYARLSHAF